MIAIAGLVPLTAGALGVLDQQMGQGGAGHALVGHVPERELEVSPGPSQHDEQRLPAADLPVRQDGVHQREPGSIVGGRGGGRADFAQAGGTQPENLGAALAGVESLVRSRLAGIRWART